MTVVLAVVPGMFNAAAIVIDERGTILGHAESPSPGSRHDPRDPEMLWRSVVDAGCRAVSEAGRPTLDAVGVSSRGETVLAWDRSTGASRSPVLSRGDRRPVEDGIRAQIDQLTRITGLELDSSLGAPKMAWLRRRATDHDVVTTADTWVVHRLCGAFVTDATTAARTLLLDVRRVGWSIDAAAIFGLDVAQLPRIVDCAHVVGTTDAFGRETPVVGLAVDRHAALFGAGLLDPGAARAGDLDGSYFVAVAGPHVPRAHGGLDVGVAWQLTDPSGMRLNATYLLCARATDVRDTRPESTTELLRRADEQLGRPIRRLRVDGPEWALSRALEQLRRTAPDLRIEVDGSSVTLAAHGMAALARIGLDSSIAPAQAVKPPAPIATFGAQAGA